MHKPFAHEQAWLPLRRFYLYNEGVSLNHVSAAKAVEEGTELREGILALDEVLRSMNVDESRAKVFAHRDFPELCYHLATWDTPYGGVERQLHGDLVVVDGTKQVAIVTLQQLVEYFRNTADELRYHVNHSTETGKPSGFFIPSELMKDDVLYPVDEIAVRCDAVYVAVSAQQGNKGPISVVTAVSTSSLAQHERYEHELIKALGKQGFRKTKKK